MNQRSEDLFESEHDPENRRDPEFADRRTPPDVEEETAAPAGDSSSGDAGVEEGSRLDQPQEDLLPFPPVREDAVPPQKAVYGRAAGRSGPSVRRLAIWISFLAAVSIAALWGLNRFVGGSDQSDILAVIPDSRVQLSSFFEVNQGEDLAQLVLRHSAWRVSVPEIEGSSPAGLGFAEIRAGISIPVLVYGESDGTSLLVSIVNYAFLDTHDDLLRLDRRLLDALSEENTFVLPPSSDRLLWRTGDDIFMVSTGQSREALAGRIFP